MNFKDKRFRKRIFMSIVGVVLTGISVGFFKTAVFGVDPFTVIVSGMDAVIPLDYGLVYILLNVVLLLFSIIFDRRNIGLATVVNLFLLGYITQFCTAILAMIFPEPSILVRIICFVVGMGIISFGASFYMTAEMGVSTYDAIAITLSDKFHWGQFRIIRIITDVSCVVCGGALYYTSTGEFSSLLEIIGIGTIINAFCMGPLIDFFNRKASRPFLDK